MDAALVVSAALLGLAGTPHCAAMCAAPCAAATAGRGVAGSIVFQLARVGSYSLAGAVAASSVGALARLSQLAPAVRPVWTLVHAAAFVLGLWLLWQGRQPAWMGRLGRVQMPAAVSTVSFTPGAAAQPVRALRPALFPALFPALAAGALWAAWPCGLLQSALLVAALTAGAASGAAAMAAFAVCSSAGLLLAPLVWGRWLAGPGTVQRERALARLGGALLALASGWALTHGLWHQVAVWCGVA